MTVSPEMYLYNATEFAHSFDVTDYVTASSTVNSTSIFYPMKKEPVEQTFHLSVHGTFCEPAQKPAGKESTVIVATHGIEGDGEYWNSSYVPEKYSFVGAAAKQGYSTFYYDRIGNGNFDQLLLQVDVLANLVEAVKAGKYTGSLGVPGKVVVLGHYFGSFVTTTLLATQPTLVDGAILTGLGYSPTASAPFFEAYQCRIAAKQDPTKFGELDTGVLAWIDVLANIGIYFKKPNYEVEVAEYSEAVKQSYTVGETLSLA